MLLALLLLFVQVSVQLDGQDLTLREGARTRVQGGRSVTLAVTLRRLNRPGRDGVRVHAPRYCTNVKV